MGRELRQDMEITVLERESELTGVARVVALDRDRRLVYVSLEWSTLTVPPGGAA